MRKCRPQARDVPLKGSGAKASLKSPKPSEPLQVALQWKLLQLVVTSANSRFRNVFPFVITFHSKLLSIRNGFGITPKGPMGPFLPKGAEGALGSLGSPYPFVAPWAPFGPLGPLGSHGSPWVPWVPLGPWVPPKVSAPCRSENRASRKLGGGADSAEENILGRRHARKRIWIY